MLAVNGVSQSLSISLADALLSMLSGEAQERQLHQQWLSLWQLSLKLMSSLLDSLGHQFISHALDFTGVNQERLVKVTIKNKNGCLMMLKLVNPVHSTIVHIPRTHLLHSYCINFSNFKILNAFFILVYRL